MSCALSAGLEVLSARITASQASMATPGVPASVVLFEIACGFSARGRYARAAEKFGCAAAAAAQELAGAEDCLVMAYLRAAQAHSLISYSVAPNLPVAEAEEARQTIKSVLLPQCVSTLTRRKAAGTLLRGSCRVAEVEWYRVFSQHRMLQDGITAEVARAGAAFSAPEVGLDAYLYAACAALKVVNCAKMYSLSREMQLSHAALVASAFDLMALPRELPSVVKDDGNEITLPSPLEQSLAHTFQVGYCDCKLDYSGVLSQVVDAWRRVERSGAAATRWLLDDFDPSETIGARYAAAAAEAAARGLRECALAGCSSKEVHVSQFKCCGACRTVAYCCREHQLADWPAHKAACKAARRKADAGQRRPAEPRSAA